MKLRKMLLFLTSILAIIANTSFAGKLDIEYVVNCEKKPAPATSLVVPTGTCPLNAPVVNDAQFGKDISLASGTSLDFVAHPRGSHAGVTKNSGGSAGDSQVTFYIVPKTGNGFITNQDTLFLRFTLKNIDTTKLTTVKLTTEVFSNPNGINLFDGGPVTKSVLEIGSGLEIKTGFTLLKTAEIEETSLDLKSVSGPQVLLKGNAELLTKFTHELISNGSLSEKQFASIDAVVELKQAINVNPGGSVTGEAELVGLSLKSTKPLDIGFLNSSQKGTLADLYVTVGVVDLSKENNNFTKKPSTGKITVRYEKDSGGSFKCTLGVYPDLIFVKAGGDFNNRKDWLLPTQSPGGKPFGISGTGTWRSEKGK